MVEVHGCVKIISDQRHNLLDTADRGNGAVFASGSHKRRISSTVLAPPNCHLPIQGSRTNRQKTLDYHGFQLNVVPSVEVGYSNYGLPAFLFFHLDMAPIHLLIH